MSSRSRAIIGGHEVKPVNMLLSLEKKPVESYFEGLRSKPIGRKKIREPKKKTLNFWDACNEGWIPTSAKAPPKEREQSAAEGRLLDIMIQRKIKTYERMEKHKQRNISMRQRLAEEKYLEQQANLAETWLGVMNRRSQLRNVNSDDFADRQSPAFDRPSSGKGYNRIDISILSSKFWSDDEAKEPRKSKTEENKSIVRDLEEDFGEKLVFVDDEE